MNSHSQNVAIRLLQLFLGGIASNLTKPFFAALLAIGIGASSAGLALSLSAAFAVLAGLYSGGQSDAVGRKKVMLLGEVIRVFGAGLLFLGFASTDVNYGLALMGFSLHAIGSSYARSAGDALLFDSVTKDNKKFILQAHYWIWNLTVLVGYLVGGMFLEGREKLFFLGLLLVALVDFGLIKFLIIDTLPTRRLTRSDWSLKSIPIGILQRDRKFRIYVSAATAQLMVELGFFSVLAVLCVENAISVSFLKMSVSGLQVFGILILINASVILAGTPIYAVISVRVSDSIEISLGLTLMTLGIICALSLGSGAWMLTGILMFSFGELIFKPARNSLFLQLTPDGSRGAYVSLNGLIYRFATMVAPLLLTLFGVFGAVSTIVVSTSLLAISLLLFSPLLQKEEA